LSVTAKNGEELKFFILRDFSIPGRAFFHGSCTAIDEISVASATPLLAPLYLQLWMRRLYHQRWENNDFITTNNTGRDECWRLITMLTS
jgi:hypothetical protein